MSKKNWTGDSNSIYKTLGASNHTEKEREKNDYYATEPKAVRLLMENEYFDKRVPIWECACGENHLVDEMRKMGYKVFASDVVKRGCEDMVVDFLKVNLKKPYHGHIVTNPPYKYALEFVEKGLELLKDGYKLALFLKLQFLEGKRRKKIFLETPPKVLYVSSSRLLCAKNGGFERMRDGGGSAVAYGWFVWEKGFKGNTLIKWIN